MLAALTAIAACARSAAAPPAIVLDRTACAHCGMLVSDEVFAAAYAASGSEPRVFDDIGCLLEAVGREPVSGGGRFWFHDAETADWIEGAEATFVRSSRLRTPMGGGLVAYRDAAAAQRAAAAHAGQVFRTLSELLADGKGRGL